MRLPLCFLVAAALVAREVRAVPSVKLIGLHAADQSVLGLQGDRDAYISPARVVSSDGRYVCIVSEAENLVAGDTNGVYDVFRRDRLAGTTLRASVGTGGQQANGPASECAMTPDGRYVVFSSSANNLAPGVAFNGFNVYLRDMQAQTTELVSVAAAGGGANNHSVAPSISADGRYVAFASLASNLVAGDDNGLYDVFVRDRQLGTTTLASVADNGGAQRDGASLQPEISSDGRFVAFRSSATNLVAGDTNDVPDIFVRDLDAGSTERVSVAADGAQSSGPSLNASISADGRYVAFDSYADNLVLDDPKGRNDVFVRDRVAGTTRCASLPLDPTRAGGDSFLPSISADGALVAFVSYSSGLVGGDSEESLDAFVHDNGTGGTRRISAPPGTPDGDGPAYVVALSATGRYAAFYSEASDLVAGDTNERADVFVRDFVAGSTARASLADDSGPFPANANGGALFSTPTLFAREVLFTSAASNLVPGDRNRSEDVFVRDPATQAIDRASTDGNATSSGAAISRDGNVVAFESASDDLVAGDDNEIYDVFVRDRTAQTTVRIAAFDGGDPDGDCFEPAISADGRFVAFTSNATNLTGPPSGAPPARYDVYVHDRMLGTTVLASADAQGQRGNGDSFSSSISADGRYVAFNTFANSLATGDPSLRQKVVRRDLLGGGTLLASAAPGATPPNGPSGSAPHAISDDGRFVVFESEANNLVAGDTNGRTDVFLRDLEQSSTTRASVASGGAQADGTSQFASISADGRFVLFTSDAANLAHVTSFLDNVYLRDRRADRTALVSTDAARTIGNGPSGIASIAPDGRNASFLSASGNWTLDGGAQSAYFDPFLVRLIEQTQATLVPRAPSEPGQAAQFDVQLAGTDTNPRGGSVTVSASTGESCTTSALFETATTVSIASCALTFATPGARTVSASYLGSPNYLASNATPIGHLVAVDALFSNGFE